MLMRVWQKSIEQEKVRVFVFQQLQNNYSYLVEIRSSAVVIDPAESQEILDVIKENQLDLKAVLLTHYHEDYVLGVKGILKDTSPQVVGPATDLVDLVDSVVSEQEELIIGPFAITAIGTPGHTLNHLCYFLTDFKILFTGDAVFPCGCKKNIEGSYQQMLDSIKVIKALPKDTHLFSGHEYSIGNLQFALLLEPNRQDIKERIDSINNQDQYPIPTTIALELDINPFFKTDNIEFRKILNLGSASELEMFTKLRQIKETQK